MFILRKKELMGIFLSTVSIIFFFGMAWGSGQAPVSMNLTGRWYSSTGADFIIDQNDNRVEWFCTDTGEKIFGAVFSDILDADWNDIKISGKIFTDNTGIPSIIEWENKVIFTRIFPNMTLPHPLNISIDENNSTDRETALNWDLLFQDVKDIYASGKHLYLTTKTTGDIYKRGTSGNWFRIGGPGLMFACNYKGNVYGISNDPKYQHVWWYSGTPNKWSKIKEWPTESIFAGGNQRQVGAIDFFNKNVFLYHLKGCSPDCVWEWTKIGGPGAQFVQAYWSIFALGVGKESVWEWDGGQNWKHLGGAAYMIAVDRSTTVGEALFALSPNRRRVMRYFPGTGWRDYTFNLPNNKKTIDAGWNVLVAHFGEEAWMLQDQVKQWVKISGAWRVKSVTAAGENKPAIYCLFKDDSLWRYKAFD